MCDGNCKQCLLSEIECQEELEEMQQPDDDAIRQEEWERNSYNEW